MGYATAKRRPTAFIGVDKNSRQASGLLRWYSFSAQSPGGLTVMDFAGRGRHADITNKAAVDFWKLGRSGYAGTFDAAGSVDHLVATTLPISGIPPGLSASVWLKRNSNPTLAWIFAQYTSDASSSQQFQIVYISSINSYRCRLDLSSGTHLVDFGDSVTGTWHHVAVSWNGSELRGYFNGKRVATTSSATGTVATLGQNLYIGARYESLSLQSPFDGQMDDLRFYNRSMTDSDVFEIYRNPYDLWLQPRFYIPSDQAAAPGGFSPYWASKATIIAGPTSNA